jgi:hypothetical protein
MPLRSFGKTRYRYLEVGEHVYWVSRSWYDRGARIINRRLADDDPGRDSMAPTTPDRRRQARRRDV